MTDDYKFEVHWKRLFFLFYIHIAGCLAFFVEPPSWKYSVFLIIYGLLGRIGISAGAHRLFCHRSFKANTPLRFLLAIFQAITVENSVYTWTLRHRVHHKCTDTNADPHNSKRGLLFSHCTWVMYKLHPDFEKQAKQIDMSDLESDKIVMWQHKYFSVLELIVNGLIPTLIGYKVFGESLLTAYHYNFLRIMLFLNFTFIVNSAGHVYGKRPYDTSETAVDSPIVNVLSLGEGFHNYHHTFPYDYKASETKSYLLNFITGFIDFCAMIGWATDLKEVSKESLKSRVLKAGDGSHEYSKEVGS